MARRREECPGPGTRAAGMPVLPASAWPAPPEGVAPTALVWAETVAGGNYTRKVLARGTELRLTDLAGDACAHVLLHVDGRPWERLNAADTVKVLWNAYPGEGRLLLSDQGRVRASVVADTSGRHDALCGTSSTARNTARHGDGCAQGPSPAGRELFKPAALKNGLEPRDLPPSVSFFQGARVLADGGLEFTGSAGPGGSVTLRAEQFLTVLIANVPHPLDPRPDYVCTPLEVLAWRGLAEIPRTFWYMCAAAVPAGTVGGLPFGVMLVGRAFTDERMAAIARLAAPPVRLAVVGAHLSGQPLDRELVALGARRVAATATAPAYRLYALATNPPKPGLVRVAEGGAAVEAEVWELPAEGLGALVAALPGPMAIGGVELADGSRCPASSASPQPWRAPSTSPRTGAGRPTWPPARRPTGLTRARRARRARRGELGARPSRSRSDRPHPRAASVPDGKVPAMSTRTKYAVGAVAAAIIVLWILPWWLAIPLLALPVVGYLALDSSQRRRLGRVTRKRLER